MRRDLRGFRLLVTGASSGIGRCLAEQAGLAGAHVVVAARSQEPLNELAESLTTRGAQAFAVTADVTDDADRRRLLAAAVERLGGLDGLINNAGVASFGHFFGSSEEVLRRVMEVNFFAPAELIRLAVPVLTEGRQPAIVNISSMCGRRGLPAWPEYSASKAALVGLTEALRGEMVRFGIDVLLLLPGLTQTGLGRTLLRNAGRMKIEFDRGMPAERVAAGVLRALERNRTETILGWEAKLILRVNRFFPRLADWVLARRVRQLYAEKKESEAASGVS
jgi:short-subunit dehydrogenase